MKIYIGADHNGFQLRNALMGYLRRAGYDVVDDGDEAYDPKDDYPIYAKRVVTHVLTADDPDPRGILICGSGQGMCMAANRHKGIRAALGYDRESVRSSRNDDNSNILCLPAKVLEKDAANILVETWLHTPFGAAERYSRRLVEMDQ